MIYSYSLLEQPQGFSTAQPEQTSPQGAQVWMGLEVSVKGLGAMEKAFLLLLHVVPLPLLNLPGGVGASISLNECCDLFQSPT